MKAQKDRIQGHLAHKRENVVHTSGFHYLWKQLWLTMMMSILGLVRLKCW